MHFLVSRIERGDLIVKLRNVRIIEFLSKILQYNHTVWSLHCFHSCSYGHFFNQRDYVKILDDERFNLPARVKREYS